MAAKSKRRTSSRVVTSMVENINQMAVEGFFFDDFVVVLSGKKFIVIRLVLLVKLEAYFDT